jgi:hypothetical protein
LLDFSKGVLQRDKLTVFRTYFLLTADALVPMQFKMYVVLSFRNQSMLFNDASCVSTGSDVDGQLVFYK